MAKGVSPDTLLRDFRGNKVLLLVVATVLLHVVVILGTSYGYIRDKLFGTDTTELSKKERISEAMGKVRTTLAEIAKEHDLALDDLIDNLAGAGSRASRIRESDKAGTAKDTKTPPADDKKEPGKKEPGKKEPDKKEPGKKQSELEKNFPGAKPGPKIPKVEDEDKTGLP